MSGAAASLVSAEEAGARARAVKALLVRQQIESSLVVDKADAARWTRALARLAEHLQREGLAEGLTDDEATMLGAPVGTWPAELVTDAAWRLEGLAVLLWALGKIERPPLDAPVEPALVHEAAPLFPTKEDLAPNGPWPATGGENGDRAAPFDEMARAAGILRWRARTELAHRAARRADAGRYRAVVERGSRKAAEAGLVELAAGDVACRGKPFASLSTPSVREVGAVAIERERACAWLLGRAAWDAPREL